VQNNSLKVFYPGPISLIAKILGENWKQTKIENIPNDRLDILDLSIHIKFRTQMKKELWFK